MINYNRTKTRRATRKCPADVETGVCDMPNLLSHTAQASTETGQNPTSSTTTRIAGGVGGGGERNDSTQSPPPSLLHQTTTSTVINTVQETPRNRHSSPPKLRSSVFSGKNSSNNQAGRRSAASVISKPTGFIQENIVVPGPMGLPTSSSSEQQHAQDVRSESYQFLSGLTNSTRDRLKATSTPNDDTSVKEIFP